MSNNSCPPNLSDAHFAEGDEDRADSMAKRLEQAERERDEAVATRNREAHDKYRMACDLSGVTRQRDDALNHAVQADREREAAESRADELAKRLEEMEREQHTLRHQVETLTPIAAKGLVEKDAALKAYLSRVRELEGALAVERAEIERLRGVEARAEVWKLGLACLASIAVGPRSEPQEYAQKALADLAAKEKDAALRVPGVMARQVAAAKAETATWPAWRRTAHGLPQAPASGVVLTDEWQRQKCHICKKSEPSPDRGVYLAHGNGGAYGIAPAHSYCVLQASLEGQPVDSWNDEPGWYVRGNDPALPEPIPARTTEPG